MADEETQAEESVDSTDPIADVFSDDPDEGSTIETDAGEEKGETEDKPDGKPEGKPEDKASQEEKPEPPSDESERLKRENAGLKAALAAARAEKRKEKAKAPDPVEDPEGFARHQQAQDQEREFRIKSEISRSLLKKEKADYEDMEKVFMSLVAEGEGEDFRIIDPTLHQRFLNAENPALFAYETAQEHLQMQKLRDPKYLDGLKAEWEKEFRVQWEKEQKEKKAVPQVPDLATATASGSNVRKTETLPENPGELFDDED